MKKVVLGILITFLFSNSFSQSIINRATAANTIQDARFSSLYNLFIPKYRDTIAANAQKGIDSSAALIFTYDVNAIWYRQYNPKKWVLLSNGNAPIYTADRGVQILPSNVIRLTDTVEGAGTKFQWIYDKAAFRAGIVDGTQWNIANIGDYSFAVGENNIASGTRSFGSGGYNLASGDYSTAIGAGNVASEIYSTAIGSGNEASGASSFAVGETNSSSGQSAVSIGNQNISSGSNSITVNSFNKAIGNNAFVSGVGNYMNTLNGSVFGAYNDTTGYSTNNPSAQVATNPIFTIGNGTGIGSRSNSFQMLRNGATKFSSGITATTDTTTFKPVVMDANGNLRKVGSWSISNIAGWALIGNSGTIDGTNFIGTTDNIPFNIRVNNVRAGRIENSTFGTYLGYQSGLNTTGTANTAIGHSALKANTTGFSNTAIGYSSLVLSTLGTANVAIGYEALDKNTTGSLNTAVGVTSLTTNTSGEYNTAIGYSADVSDGAWSNATAIGANAVVDASNKMRFGDGLITVIEGQVDWSFPSDVRFKNEIKRNVPGLNFIKKLKPITYKFDRQKMEAYTKTGILNKDFHTKDSRVQTGLSAQEVEKTAKEIGYDFSGINAPQSDKGHYSLSYSQFVVPLIQAVQEQQKMIENLQSQIDKLKNKIK